MKAESPGPFRDNRLAATRSGARTPPVDLRYETSPFCIPHFAFCIYPRRLAMTDSGPVIAYLTAGAGGMYCGSCMHDNTLARALRRRGVDVQLIPTYTPIRTDEEDVSVHRVFYGGINVFLEEKLPLFRRLPALLDRWLAQPWLIRLATSRAINTDARKLGALTVSMLRGTEGHQRKEVNRLCDWLVADVKPQLVNLSNMLIAGCVPELKRRLDVPVLVTIQGDDIFLDALPEPHKGRVLDEIARLVPLIDGFVVHSQYYADYMGKYLGIPAERIHVAPLGIDTSDFGRVGEGGESGEAVGRDGQPPTIGYLARLAPEKGLHNLVDAFIDLRERPGMQQARLHIAGWLGGQHKTYAEEQFQKLRAAVGEESWRYWGSVDRHQKIEFLRGLDVLSVPTVYHEPKGIYVLEALAAGVPVVQPEHGAFPELLAATEGGRLVRPGDAAHLSEVLHELLSDPEAAAQLGRTGRQRVLERFGADAMADAMLEVYGPFLR